MSGRQRQRTLDELKMQGVKVPRVTEFRYLGSTVQADGGNEIEVTKRIAAGWNSWRKVTGVLCDRKVPLSVKGKLHKVVVRPAMLYGTETLAVTQGMEKKPEAAKMKMLRFECGVARLDKVRNEVIRSKLKVEQLGAKMREGRLVVWSCGKTRKWVRGKESDGDGIRKKEERKTQKKVDGLYKSRP